MKSTLNISSIEEKQLTPPLTPPSPIVQNLSFQWFPSTVLLSFSTFQWLPESCYFLMTNGKKDEAIKLLERAAKENGKKLPIGRLVTEAQKNRYHWSQQVRHRTKDLHKK